MRLLTALAIGIVFGLGISLSGMINPAKVINFFDIAGTWDPSLAFVMMGALAVAIPGYRLAWAQKKPTQAATFQLPDTRRIDRSLVAGSAVFGIGWGIAGFCPGAALPALGTGIADVYLFVAAVLCGHLLARGARTAIPAFGR